MGDDWVGLGQLEQASLRLPKGSCQQLVDLERQLNPLPYGELFRQAAAAAGLDPALLQAVARQESRFTAGVESPVGAMGLMQLMPSTASELAGRRLEAPWLCGGVARMSAEHGLAAPVNRTLYAALKPFVDGPRA